MSSQVSGVGGIKGGIPVLKKSVDYSIIFRFFLEFSSLNQQDGLYKFPELLQRRKKN